MKLSPAEVKEIRAHAQAILDTLNKPAPAPLGFTVRAGKIYDGVIEIQLRGVSHFGFNTEILIPEFLWNTPWKDQIAQMKSLDFNAVRVPFVPDTLYADKTKAGYVDPGMNPELVGKAPLEVLDLWMAEADRQGLYILLDFHSVTKAKLYPQWFTTAGDEWLIYDGKAYTQERWIADLVSVATRYAHLPHFIGLDLCNEPYGARWDAWKAAAELAASAVLKVNPLILVFVQGIAGNFDGIEMDIPMNYGEDLQPQAYAPLAIPADKLVLSPHTYGPDVFPKTSFSAPNFPANLAADWELLFGQFYPAHAVVPGEFGGRYGTGKGGSADVAWQDAFVDYMISKGIRDSFYWCFTPNSTDTGGILNDDLSVREDKMTLLERLWG